MKLEDFLAKCPRCGTELTLDEMGCDHCVKCDGEFKEQGDYEAMANLTARIIDELDTRQLIIPKKKLEELKLLIQSSISRETLEQELKKNYDEASPYTGEYYMGKADFINELLGNSPIDWDEHPRSLKNMIRRSKEIDGKDVNESRM